MNLSRLSIFNFSRLILNEKIYNFLVNNQIISEILSFPKNESNIFFHTIENFFQITFSNNIIQKIRNDKYYLTYKGTEIITKEEISYTFFKLTSYINLKERATAILFKQTEGKIEGFNSTEMKFPPIFYKINQKKNSILKEKYQIPKLEIIEDWINYLEGVFNNLQTVNGEQNTLIEVYLIQAMIYYLIEQDEEQCKIICEKISNYINNNVFLFLSPENLIIVHTWLGILSEKRNYAEAEQHFIMAILVIHKLYGDPRGRGSNVIPWELFITLKLSIMLRSQNKIQDAEYIEEIYDATFLGINNKERLFYNYFYYYYYF